MAPLLMAIIDTPQLSGPGRQLTALLSALPEAGYEVELVTFRRSGRSVSTLVTHAESHGVRVTVIPERGPFDRTQYAALRSHIALRRPSIVQTHSYKATALVWLLRRSGLAFGWVGCFHGATTENLKVRAYHKLDQRLLRSADQMVIMAESQRAGLGRAGARAKVINNAVLPPPSASGGAIPDWAVPAGQPLIGYVGRLSPEKGVDLLLKALHRVRTQIPDQTWTAVIAGEGPERDSLEAQATALGLSPLVRFLGQVSNPWSVYQAAALVVLPSRSEGLPNVMLEAIAADLSVIATRVGAIPDVIGTSAAATLVPANNVEALAGAIDRFLTQPPNPSAAADRAAIREAYSLERRVAAHLEIYRSIAGSTNRPVVSPPFKI